MTRIYNGTSWINDSFSRNFFNDYFRHPSGVRLNPLHQYQFTAVGTYGKYVTYRICDKAGNLDPNFEKVEFIRCYLKSAGTYVFIINMIDGATEWIEHH